jgi:hypothetical protein
MPSQPPNSFPFAIKPEYSTIKDGPAGTGSGRSRQRDGKSPALTTTQIAAQPRRKVKFMTHDHFEDHGSRHPGTGNAEGGEGSARGAVSA